MNTINSFGRVLLSSILVSLFSGGLTAQVTIGSHVAPQKGALLDLKESDGNNNSTRGILFPRVILSERYELYPMFGDGSNEDPEYTADKSGIKAEHKGLIVYNLTDTNSFNEGLYVWDGTEWKFFENKTVLPPQIEELLCEQDRLSPIEFQENVFYEGVLTIPYIGGNGMPYKGSILQAGSMTIELIPGTLNVGPGLLYYKVSGTPVTEMISLGLSFAGKTCQVLIESKNDVEIKTMQYVRNRVDVSSVVASNRENTLTTLGNLEVRYDGSNSGHGYIQFRTLKNTHVTYQYTKHGQGGNFLGRYGQLACEESAWYGFANGGNRVATPSNTTEDINLTNRDIATATFVLHNTKEVYRLTVNANNTITPYGTVPGTVASVSIFIERLD